MGIVQRLHKHGSSLPSPARSDGQIRRPSSVLWRIYTRSGPNPKVKKKNKNKKKKGGNHQPQNGCESRRGLSPVAIIAWTGAMPSAIACACREGHGDNDRDQSQPSRASARLIGRRPVVPEQSVTTPETADRRHQRLLSG